QSIPGYEYGYSFDDIGNRIETETNTRKAAYEVNILNQYLNREVPRFVDVLGEANDAATVSVQGLEALRAEKPGPSDYFYLPLPYGEDGAPAYEPFRIRAETEDAEGGLLAYDLDQAVFLSPDPENYQHDA